MRKLSGRQVEILKILDGFGIDGTDGWGEVWAAYEGHSGLAFRNFDRVAASLVRRGLVSESPGVSLTEAGERAAKVYRCAWGPRCPHQVDTPGCWQK